MPAGISLRLMVFGGKPLHTLSVSVPAAALPRGAVIRNPPAVLETRGHAFDPCARKIPGRRAWQPTPVFLPGESRGWRSLVGYGP